MVFECRQEDRVAWAQMLSTPSRCHLVQRRGGAASENDLVGVLCSDEPRNRLAAAFELRRRLE